MRTERKSRPWERAILWILIINVQNIFHNKKFHKAPEIGKCMIKIFMGGKGWWMGRGVAVMDA